MIHYKISEDRLFSKNIKGITIEHMGVTSEVKELNLEKLSIDIYSRYEKYMRIISNLLNEYHQTKHDLFFWKKLFNYGVLNLITELHQHFTFLQKHFDSQKMTFNSLSSRSFKIHNKFEDQRIYLQTDIGYEHIFSLYLMFFKLKSKELIGLKKSSKWEENKFKAKKYFYFIYLNLKDFLNKKDKIEIGILNSYFTKQRKKELLKESEDKIKEIYLFDSIVFNSKYDLVYREKIKQNFNKDHFDLFDEFFFFSLKYFLPTIYLENFKKIKFKLEKKLKKYSNLKSIVSEAWVSDTQSSFFLAISREKNIKHICNEHNSITHPFVGDFLKISRNSSDYFLNFGWEDSINKTIKSSSNYKFKLEKKAKKDIEILFICGPYGKIFPFYCSSYGSCGYNSDKIIEFNKFFFKNLNSSTLKKIRFRKYPKSYSQQIKIDHKKYDSFLEDFSLIGVDVNENSLTQMSKSKLVIVDYFSTSVLESLCSGIPTILLLGGNYELNNEYSTFFESLIKAGIIQESPTNAANLVDEIIHDPDKWWNSEKVKNGLNLFLSENLNTDNSLNDFLLNSHHINRQ